MAGKLRRTISDLGYGFYMAPQTNQLFPILPSRVRECLAENFTFIEMDWVGEDLRVCRFCTSWATKEENVDRLCRELEILSAKI
jgi:threonine aldolase